MQCHILTCAPLHRRPQDQQCYVDEETGEVVVQFHETDIVRVNISGDVKLTSGGFHTVRDVVFGFPDEGQGQRQGQAEGRLRNAVMPSFLVHSCPCTAR